MRQLKIGTSSVRGVVSEPLTPELIVDFACAFGTYCDGGAVVIGRDTRQSSVMLRAAALSSLLSTGCRVIDLGVCPTPLVSFAVRTLGAAGSLSITGSHNDARWNALKFLGPDGALLNALSSEEVMDIYHAADFTQVPWDRLQPWAPADDLAEAYVAHLCAALDVERIRRQGLRVAVDFCNGTGAPLMARFLHELGCTLIPLNEEPGSEFAHPPAPSAANMRQLGALLRYLEADLGAAINIDGDRIGFVTAAGTPLSEEHTLPLVADYLLGRRAARAEESGYRGVVTNLSTSRMVDEVARTYGQPVVRTLIGEGHVVDRAQTERALLAGEGSGGVAVLPTAAAFDGFLTLGLVLEAIAATGESLQQLVDRLPQFYMRKGSIACPPDLVYQVLEGFRAAYAAQPSDRTEGIRVEWDDAWVHIRASNTEPLLRVIVEANDATRADRLFDEVMSHAHRVAFGNAGRA
jgi:phosphomannomutase